MTRWIATRLLSVLAFLSLALPAHAEIMRDWGIWTQDPASPIMEEITNLHNILTVIIILITIFVFALLGYIIMRFNAKANPVPSKVTHHTMLEVVWTLVPIIILVGIAFPSFKLLYAMDKVPNADLTLKVTAHQWYWSYELPDQGVSFDSHLVEDADLKPGQPRLLTADNMLVLPVGLTIRVLVTSTDVIHDWAVPALGVKTDAVPGRLNETWVRIDKPGTYYGQCDQLCGVNHGFMPIDVQAVTRDQFNAWLDRNKAEKKSSLASGPTLAAASR